MARRIDMRAPDFAAQFEALLGAKREIEADVAVAVRAILTGVRARGDAALIELTQRFDRATLTPDTLRLRETEIAEAESECSKEALAALAVASERIETYHRRQLPKDEFYEDETGAELGWRWTPLDSVGLYVPGGTASYPSSVLMNAVPARVTGVPRPAKAGGP